MVPSAACRLPSAPHPSAPAPPLRPGPALPAWDEARVRRGRGRGAARALARPPCACALLARALAGEDGGGRAGRHHGRGLLRERGRVGRRGGRRPGEGGTGRPRRGLLVSVAGGPAPPPPRGPSTARPAPSRRSTTPPGARPLGGHWTVMRGEDPVPPSDGLRPQGHRPPVVTRADLPTALGRPRGRVLGLPSPAGRVRQHLEGGGLGPDPHCEK